ncbi:cyclin-dependent kinase 5 homolog [Watersipora subatra]|uniref:cyclin-dependent kinase 5 homolog n=1 Tax=Watersipora subatra TaxID=2589382 RepID=UPI00355B7585
METLKDALPEPFSKGISTLLKLQTHGKEHFDEHYQLLVEQSINGSFGKIYHVSSIANGKEYAIKKVTVRSCSYSHHEFIQTLQESSLSRSIGDDPNLVKSHPDLHWLVLPESVDADDVLEVLSQGVDLPLPFLERFIGTEIYMVFDWYDDDLQSVMDASGSETKALIKITKTDSMQILLHILLGLCFLHKNGIIHNDIKPNNILIDRARSNQLQLRAVIADMGMMRYVVDSLATSFRRLRRHDYDAPDAFFTPYVDIWSFGLVGIQIMHFAKTMTPLRRSVFHKIYEFAEVEDYASIRALLKERLHGEDPFFLECLVQCLQKLPQFRPNARVLYEVLVQQQEYIIACHAAHCLHKLLGPSMHIHCVAEMIFPHYYKNVFLVAVQTSGKFSDKLCLHLQELYDTALFPLPAALNRCPVHLQLFAEVLCHFLSPTATGG